jgi:putative spermidine/putrescine transport system permease protein
MTAETTATVTTPGPAAGPGARRLRNPLRSAPRPVRSAARYAGIVPFLAYIVVFLILPMVWIIRDSFLNANNNGFTWSNIDTALHGSFLHGFEQSLLLSLIASVIPGICGLLLAYAIFTAKGRGATWLRQVVITASGVFANFGGVPLAFLYIASFGSTALVTGWLSDIGLNIYNLGFSLYTLSGIALVYMYFQIPLMVLLILPALEGLRPAWREAAQNLGAEAWQYWRYVGGPVLLPSFMSCVMLLFGSALAAYATAEALTTGTIPLTSIQIGTFLNGNVVAGQQNVGDALAFGMVVIIAVMMTAYFLFQRRSAKWLR